MTVFEAINNRKSIRRYTDQEVKQDDITKILEAGILAPSAKNRQNLKFIVITDKDTNRKMRKSCGGQNMIGQAPVSLVVLSEGEWEMPIGLDAGIIDASIALSFMMLQATELGLSTCWLGLVNADMLKETLNIPENFNIVAVTPLGYAAEDGLKRRRKTFEQMVSFNQF